MYQKLKRILALTAVVIILLLYAATFILSLLPGNQAKDLLMVSIVATVVIPVLLYIYLWLFRLFLLLIQMHQPFRLYLSRSPLLLSSCG